MLDPDRALAYNVTMFAKHGSDLKRALLFFAFAVFVSGCAAATGPNDTGETSETRGEDPAPPTTMILTSSEPPGSTLSYNGDSVDGGLGTYCWFGGGGGACVDAIGISLKEGALKAPTGATLSFAYEGKALDSLSVAAYRADREGEGGGRDDVFVPPHRGDGGAKDLRVRRSGTRARVVADLPAGEYVLGVFARMPQGDASYGFRLVVEPRDAAGRAPEIRETL